MDSNNTDEASLSFLEFNDLPPEIRELIWEFTLPDCRIFHVEKFSRHRPVLDESTREMFFRFHIHHPPPVTSQVCSEARVVALRKGFFLSPHDNHPGNWFNPDKDILYLDRNQRTSFHVKPNQPRMSVEGWDRILHIGLEWRAFFRDIPRPTPDETIGSYWKGAIDPLYTYMPNLRSVNYILPSIRYKGGITWGREPFGAQEWNAELVPLEMDAPIPWETSRNLGNRGDAMRPQMLAAIQSIGRVPAATVVTWGEVKRDIEDGFNEVNEDAEPGEGSSEEKTPSHDPEFYPPRVRGWWLNRPGLPTDNEVPHYLTTLR